MLPTKTDYQTFCPKDTSWQRRDELGVGDIFANAAKCKKCGDEIRSCNKHDYVQCKCGAIAVDGGSFYVRRVGELDAIEEKVVLYDDLREEDEKSY